MYTDACPMQIMFSKLIYSMTFDSGLKKRRDRIAHIHVCVCVCVCECVCVYIIVDVHISTCVGTGMCINIHSVQ